MFHPDVVAARQQRVLKSHYAHALPGRRFTRYTVSDVRGFLARFADAFTPEGTATRRWTPEEQAFIANEQLLTKIDFRYWAERYAMVLSEGTALKPLFPLWESQELALSELARLEKSRIVQGHPDGLLVMFLKAAQLGMSTLTQAIICHRTTTNSHRAGLIAADVPDQSAYLFDMYERVLDHLPWYLKPGEVFHTKDEQVVFDNGSFVNVESGKSMRGALQDDGGTKGQMGRGKTYSAVHLSELSGWERAEQLMGSLFPRIPVQLDSFCGLESTALGRDNWWHLFWNESVAGTTRFTPIFIAWFTVASKYWLPAPEGWEPNDTTKEMAARAELCSRRWLRRPANLRKEQLYWYETRRAEAEGIEQLGDFLAEYPTDPEEAFQYSGRTIFPVSVIEAIQTSQANSPQRATWAISLDKIVSDRMIETPSGPR
jgi:hypothetical protein